MVRRNTRRRPRNAVSGRGSGNRRSIARAITRIEQRTPYRVACAADPPSVSLGLNITKYVVVNIRTAAEVKAIDYGLPTRPGLITIKSGPLPYEIFLTRWDILMLIGSQTIGISQLQFGFIDMVCLRKICVWGPNDQSLIDSISATLLTPDENANQKIIPHPSPVATDSGTPARRAKVSMTVPSPLWFLADNSATAQADNLVGIVVGNNTMATVPADQNIGVIHLLISMVTGQVKP